MVSFGVKTNWHTVQTVGVLHDAADRSGHRRFSLLAAGDVAASLLIDGKGGVSDGDGNVEAQRFAGCLFFVNGLQLVHRAIRHEHLAAKIFADGNERAFWQAPICEQLCFYPFGIRGEQCSLVRGNAQDRRVTFFFSPPLAIA